MTAAAALPYKNATTGSPPGVNFINVFTLSFYPRRSQKRKKLLDLAVFFALLGSERVKAARKMLVKWTPVANFTNYLTQNKNAPGHVVWCNQFHQQNFTQLN